MYTHISPFKWLRICKRPLSWSLLPKAFDFCLVLTYGFYVTEANFFHWHNFLCQCMPNPKKTFSVDIKFICQSMKFHFLGWFFFIFRYHWHNNFTSAIKSLNLSFFGFCYADVSFLRQWLQFYVFLSFFWSWHNIFTSPFIFSFTDVKFLRQWLQF